MTKEKKKIYGVGINDYKQISINKKHLKSYNCWVSMLGRCYSESKRNKAPSYADCSVALEWHLFSNFKHWYDKHYQPNYQLDKDILDKGNRIYSPKTCCFVPHTINSLFTKCNKTRGKYLIGVTYSKSKKKYETKMRITREGHYCKRFDTEIEAFNHYKVIKETHIQKLAQEYYARNEITTTVYEALMRYRVEITD